MKKLLFILLVLTSTFIKAQDLIVPKSGDPIKAFNLELSDKYIFYTLTQQDDGQMLRIEKEKILMVRRADGSTMSEFDSQGEGKPVVSNYPEIAEEDIHGSLIAKGNCVFVPTNSAYEYERAGQNRLKELISEWGYWTVVDRPEQAHFILQYVTMTRGQDSSYIIVRPRKYYREYPFVDSFYSAGGYFRSFKKESRVGNIISTAWSSEDFGRNISNVERFYRQLKEVLINKDSKISKKFFEYHSRFLDADADNNNSHPCGYLDKIK